MPPKEPKGPDSLPPGLVGWGLRHVDPDTRRVLSSIFFAGVVIAGVLVSAVWVYRQVEGVASAVVRKTNDAVAAQEKKIADQQDDIRRLTGRLSRIEGKIDVLGDAVLTPRQRDDRRWQRVQIEPEE